MLTRGDRQPAGARQPGGRAPRAARASGAAAGERAPKWSRRRCCTGSGRPGRSYPRRADLRSRGQRGGLRCRRWPRAQHAGCRCCQARARRHPHRRSAAPGQRGPRVRAARRTKEHELQVDRLHHSRAQRTGSASAIWWLLRRRRRATRSAGWRVQRPTPRGGGAAN